MPNLTNKRILIVVAYKDYRDEELDVPKNIFGMFGAEIEIASSSLGTATGKAGGSVEVDLLFERFSGLILIECS